MNDTSDFVPTTVRTEPVQQRSAERITSLLDAAAELIDKNGIDGLTISMIQGFFSHMKYAKLIKLQKENK